MQLLVVAVGNFFFRHRNWSFPVLVAAIFAIAVPPSQTFGSEGLEHLKDGLAVVLALAGLALRGLVIGYRHVRRSGENRTIHAAALFTTGLFALCRNPLYTGNLLIVCGIFLMHGNPVVILAGTAAFGFIYAAMVAAEERYLARQFGQAYADYCAAVPRWIPNLFRLRAATAGTPFNVRRVLLVEYPNMGVTAIALTLAEMYEELQEPISHARDRSVGVLLGIVGLAVTWIVVVRVLKKTHVITA